MPPKKKRKKARIVTRERAESYPHLPGYLMIAFGLLGLFINYDLISGMEWAKAYPLLLVMFGFAVVAKAVMSRD